jgi:hypothetical protein
MTGPKRLIQPILLSALLSFSVSGIAQVQGPVIVPLPPAAPSVPSAPPGGWANACYIPSAGHACPVAQGVLVPTGIGCQCAAAPGSSGITEVVQWAN